MTHPPRTILKATGVSIDTPSGRPLFRDLHLSLGDEQVAVIGRNGVGKSTLLEVLAQHSAPDKGRITCHGKALLVPQHIDQEMAREALETLGHPRQHLNPGELEDAITALGLAVEWGHDAAMFSPGERRKLALLAAWYQQPDLLLLDEPTEDLDGAGASWLVERIHEWPHGLIVVSHDRSLLRHFQHFLFLGESGGRYLQGSFAMMEQALAEENAKREKAYLHNLRTLEDAEWHNARVCRRRARKKRLGRIHETGRAPSRALLNTNRSYAQVSQGRAARIRKHRQEQVRQWTRATRRALDSQLSLTLNPPALPPEGSAPTIVLAGVSYALDRRTLFADISLEVRRQRLAIQGPNGAGKTTLLQLMMGARHPTQGRAWCDHEKIGYIAQNAANWCTEESLVTSLLHATGDDDLEHIAALVVAHNFPLSLAQRPLRSLSPGERLRAALICLFAQTPTIECLVLDEPTGSLDFLGLGALHHQLAQWPGGLVVASHDDQLLQDIGITQRVQLAAPQDARANTSSRV